MFFNGKTLIIIGSVLFCFQLGNFFSIDSISPAFERAQVLSAISSVIIILIGFLFKEFNSKLSERVELNGENKFIFDPDIYLSFSKVSTEPDMSGCPNLFPKSEAPLEAFINISTGV